MSLISWIGIQFNIQNSFKKIAFKNLATKMLYFAKKYKRHAYSCVFSFILHQLEINLLNSFSISWNRCFISICMPIDCDLMVAGSFAFYQHNAAGQLHGQNEYPCGREEKRRRHRCCLLI